MKYKSSKFLIDGVKTIKLAKNMELPFIVTHLKNKRKY